MVTLFTNALTIMQAQEGAGLDLGRMLNRILGDPTTDFVYVLVLGAMVGIWWVGRPKQ